MLCFFFQITNSREGSEISAIQEDVVVELHVVAEDGYPINDEIQHKFDDRRG